MKRIIQNKQVFILCVLLCCGMIHTSFLYHILDEEGRLLYGFIGPFYGILFLFQIGVSHCIKVLVLKYQTLGYYRRKSKLLSFSSVFFFLLSFLLAIVLYFLMPIFIPMFLKHFLLDAFLKDFVSISRMIGIIAFFLPVLNLYRGYFAGHHLEKSLLFSYFLEIIGIMIFSLLGSFIGVSFFHCSAKNTMMIILWSFFLSHFIAFVYLFVMRYRKKDLFDEKIRKVKEPVFSDIVLLKNIIIPMVPYLFLLLFAFAFIILDIVYFSKYLELNEWMLFYSNFSIWTMIFNVFLGSFSFFLFTIIISSLIKKKIDALIYRILIYYSLLFIPITFLISFLAKPIWFLLYDHSIYGYSMLSYSIFLGFIFSFYLMMIFAFKHLDIYKPIRISLILNLVFKILFTSSFVHVFYQLGFDAYYGIIISSIFSYFLTFLYCLLVFYFQYKISFEIVIKSIIDIICGSIMMIFVLHLMRLFIPIYSNNRFIDFIIFVFYILVGVFTYFISIRFMKIKDKILFLSIDK